MLTTKLMVAMDENLNNAIQEVANFNKIKKAQAIRDALELYVKVQIELREAINVPNKLLPFAGKLKHEIHDGLAQQRKLRLSGGIR